MKDVEITYANAEAPAVSDFTLDMDEGQIVALVGESGSGKTTVIRALMGLLSGGGAITGGQILFEGKSLVDASPAHLRGLRGSSISMIFQDSGAMINPVRKVGSQFVEYLRRHQKMSRSEARAKAVEMLKTVRLDDAERVMASYPFELSGGMRQRVGIAMAMSFSPKLLLADEPTSALDVTTQAQIVREMMRQWHEHRSSIIMVTHNIGLACYMAHQILVMKDGHVVERGTREQIREGPQHPYTQQLIAAVPAREGVPYV